MEAIQGVHMSPKTLHRGLASLAPLSPTPSPLFLNYVQMFKISFRIPGRWQMTIQEFSVSFILG